jgi:hypothetical protein
MKLHVVVAARHIAKGTPRDGLACPIHLALEELGVRHLFHVGEREVVFHWGYEDKHHYPLPPEATEFVHRYDTGVTVWPFEFDLDVPDWAFEEENWTPTEEEA